MDCEFCKKTFSSKSNLLYHQKSVKYCLEIQGKDNKIMECEYCSKNFTMKHVLNEHYYSCKEKLKKDYGKGYENENKKLTEKLCEKETLIAKLTQDKDAAIVKLTQEKDAMIAKLEEKIDSLQKAIIDIASQPKTTHNNHNSNNSSNVTINNRFDIYNTKQIGDVLQKYLTKDVVARGQEGVAIMIGEYLLKGPNGEPLYECTDVARQKFEFINVDGNVETDPKATKLIRSINKSGLCAQTKTASDDLWTNTDGRMDHDKYEVYAGKVTEIMMLENDSTKLRNKLASVTARQKGKKQ